MAPTIGLTINGVAQAISLTEMSPGIYAIDSSVIADDPTKPSFPTEIAPGDPILGFGFTQPVNGQAPAAGNYQLTFSLPGQSIGPGTYAVSATLGLTLTDVGSGTVTISPFNQATIEHSYLEGNTNYSAGVDNGTSFSATPGNPTQVQNTSAGNNLNLTQNYSGMVVVVSFTVPDNTYVTGSGTFSVLATPEPSTWALLLGGVVMLGVVTRRRNRTHL